MDTIVQEYLTLKLPDHRQSRAKALAATYGLEPLDIRRMVVNAGHSLIGCDVQAYNKQTMTDDDKQQWQEKVIGPARRDFWDNITDEDMAKRKDICSIRMKETTARLKSDPEAYKAWRNKQKKTLEHLYETTDLCQRISKSVSEHFRLNGPNNYKSSFEYREVIDGIEIIFDSRWEAHCYKLLRRLGVDFTYATKRCRVNWIPFTKGTKSGWNPDFILAKHNAIIEVKGHKPVVWESWINYVRPNVLLEDLPYKIYLLDFDPRKIVADSVEEVFAACELVNAK